MIGTIVYLTGCVASYASLRAARRSSAWTRLHRIIALVMSIFSWIVVFMVALSWVGSKMEKIDWDKPVKW